jgi:hypothetical protein
MGNKQNNSRLNENRRDNLDEMEKLRREGEEMKFVIAALRNSLREAQESLAMLTTSFDGLNKSTGAVGGIDVESVAQKIPVSLAVVDKPNVTNAYSAGQNFVGFAAATTTVTVTVSSVPITSTSIWDTRANTYGIQRGSSSSQGGILGGMIDSTVCSNPQIIEAMGSLWPTTEIKQANHGEWVNNGESTFYGGSGGHGNKGGKPTGAVPKFGAVGTIVHGATEIGAFGQGAASTNVAGVRVTGNGFANHQGRRSTVASRFAT